MCAYAMSHSEASRLLPEAGACGQALLNKALPLLGREQALQRSPRSVQNCNVAYARLQALPQLHKAAPVPPTGPCQKRCMGFGSQEGGTIWNQGHVAI